MRRAEAMRKSRIRELEKLIEEAEESILTIEEDMTKDEVFSDYALMNEKCAELERLKKALDEYYDEWTKLSEE